MGNISFKFWRQDLTSGLVVFLVSLPLCLGVALASGAPLFSGIISGVIAGTVVAWLSGSELSISGPAAGMTVVVVHGIATVGSFENLLVAVVLAGFIQILLGTLKAGQLSSLVPTNVMKGVMAAIGITIIIRQLPHALGAMTNYQNESEFWDVFSGTANLAEVWTGLISVHWTAVLISGVSIFLYVFWDTFLRNKLAWLSFIPGALIVVVSSVAINQLFLLHEPGLALHQKDGYHLVTLPEITTLQSFFMEFRSPNWAMLSDAKIWWLAITIAIIGSVEGVLCLEATDKQDPNHRTSDTSKELIAQGVGNALCGFIGGLPITAVIVRSSTNVFAGAQTRLSALIQGCILFCSVLFLSPILNLIPLASLAAILIIVGYRLSNPRVFISVYKEGMVQFIPFLITLVAILSTDLLNGILIGFVSAFLFIIWSSYYSSIQVVNTGKDYLIKFTKDVTFIHRVSLKKILMSLPENSRLLIDGSRALYIDHDIYSTLEDFKWVADIKDIKIEYVEVANKEFSRMTKTYVQNKKAKRENHGKL